MRYSRGPVFTRNSMDWQFWRCVDDRIMRRGTQSPMRCKRELRCAKEGTWARTEREREREREREMMFEVRTFEVYASNSNENEWFNFPQCLQVSRVGAGIEASLAGESTGTWGTMLCGATHATGKLVSVRVSLVIKRERDWHHEQKEMKLH